MDEDYSHWRHAKDQIWESYEDCPPFKDMAHAAATAAFEQNLSREQFRDELHQFFEAYSSFLHGTNAGSDSSKWRHWHNHLRHARLGKKYGEPYLTSEMLSGAAAEYLKGELRVPKMDRALLDALIAQELFAFIDTRAGRGAFTPQLGCFGVAAAAVIGWRLLSGQEVHWDRFWIAAAIIGVLIALYYFWPRKGPLKLFQAMRDAYHLLSGSVVSVPELRHAVEQARDKGVVWPPELYAVLDDVEARTRRL